MNSRSSLNLVLIFMVAVGTTAGEGYGAELWEDEAGERSLALNTVIKGASLLSRAPDDPVLFAERDAAIGLMRARFDLKYAETSLLNADFAYEQRMRLQTEGAAGGIGANILPSGEEAAFRIAQLDWQISEGGETFEWRHEIDRALAGFHPEWGEVTIGRQAIGLGRGRLFGAVDMFTPFSTTEVDREWRRGVDAARLEYHLSDTSSVEGIGVFGTSWEESAFIGRVRGYLGPVDGELVFGKRGEDYLAAFVTSAAVLDAEVHAEAALFEVPEEPSDGGLFGSDRLVAKAVLGASYTFNIGNGLTFLGEYHYSGFGFSDIEETTVLLAADPDLAKRFLRGDTQTLGRHNLGMQASYPVNEVLNAGLLVLTSAQDGSGLISPSAAWDLRRNVTLLASAFAPWGPRPTVGVLQSEYGGTPWSLFMQVNVYF
ncbi:MAG: hypothetical protein C4530_00170 [Desulfobacteraceae bacterium]|nr:MAG: hypothetical protein C4530_00170 [Desulfobacteraceae bacterium]